MANKTIGYLPAATTLDGSELIPLEQYGSSVQTPINGELKTYLDTLYAPATTITSPVPWTPTFTGFGTVTNITAYSWRVGSELRFEIRFQAGTCTATEARITIGYNGTSANVTSASTYPTLQVCGFGGSAGATIGIVPLIEASKTYICYGAQFSGVTNVLSKRNGNADSLDNQVISVYGSVRIDGW